MALEIIAFLAEAMTEEQIIQMLKKNLQEYEENKN